MPRIVLLPKPINLFGQKKLFYSTPELIQHFMANDPRFQRPVEHARIARRLEQSLKKISASKWIIPGEADWAFLVKILENPECGNPVWTMTTTFKDKPPEHQQYTVATSVLLALIDPIVEAKLHKER